MKNPMEVLRSKEEELVRVQKEVEALRIAAPLLDEDKQNGNGDVENIRHLVKMP